MTVARDPAAVAATALDAAFADADGPPTLGVALSGGGDSVALLHAAAEWADARGARLETATIDHGLRPESAAEARSAAAAARALGLRAEILRWDDWDGAGNLQAEARAARRRLLSAWAGRRGISSVALGHTLDDQAETVLMRLGRGSGVDGLSAMAVSTEAEGTRWLRPLISVRRAALRDWLLARGVEWAEDPTNRDARFDRVRAREAIAALAPLGVTAEGLALTADRLREAREALDHGAAALAAEAARWGVCGELRLTLAPLRAAPRELARRLLRAGLARVAGATFGPRAESESRLLTTMLGLRLGGGVSLHGCLIRPDGPGGAAIMREPAAAARARPGPAEDGALWDGRFRLGVAEAGGGAVGPLGPQGAAMLARREAEGALRPPRGWSEAPRAARLATPALWREGELAAAPLAGFGEGLTAAFAPVAPWPAAAAAPPLPD
ncbi:MAG: tRNA lysidine(34) synthetase TilS [Pseudomonadota bacterium]